MKLNIIKKGFAFFTVFILLFSAIPVYSEGEVSQGTQVSGWIAENTVWTKEGSPYLLKGIVTISQNATLTIEPGVTVVGGYNLYINANGKLKAIGGNSPEERIQFRDAYINSTSFPESSVHLENSNLSRSGNGGFLLTSFGYEIFLKNNIFENGTINLSAPKTKELLILNNLFQNNATLSLRPGSNNTLVKNNSFSNKEGWSPDIEVVCSYDCQSPNLEITENNFFGLNRVYVKLSGDKGFIFNGTANYWGTTIPSKINQYIVDTNDNPNFRERLNVELIAFRPFENGHPLGELIAPKVAPVGDNQNTVTGQTDAFSTIEIWSPVGKIGEGTSLNDGTFTIPILIQKANTELRIFSTDSFGRISLEQTLTVDDVTAPVEPSIIPVSDRTKEISGFTEPNSMVRIKENGVEIGFIHSDSEGFFSLTTGECKAGNTIEVQAVDGADNKSNVVTVTVSDATPPAQPQILGAITDQTTSFEGFAEPGSIITIFSDSVEITKTTADTLGKFNVYNFTKQKAGTSIEISSKDIAGNISEPLKLVVTDITPPRLYVYQMRDNWDKVYGSSESGSKITILRDGLVIGAGVTGTDGEFAASIPFQPTNTKLTVIATDIAGNETSLEVTVADGTPPSAPIVNKVTDRNVTVTGKAEPLSSVLLVAGLYSFGKVETDINGSFTFSIPNQKAGTILELTAIDSAGNAGPVTKVTVLDATPPSTPIVNSVTNKSSAVTGKTEANATVIATITGKNYTGKSDAYGAYKISIPVQNTGISVSVVAKDTVGNTSQAKSIIVARVAPNIPVVNSLNNKSTSISGKTEKYASVTVKIGSIYYYGKADIYGNFKVSIPVQNAGITFSVLAKDSAGNSSVAKTGTVVRVAPNIPVVNGVRYYSTTVTGKTEKYVTVTVKIGTSYYSAKADVYGNFKVYIPKQRVGTILYVTAKNTLNQISATRTVKVY